MKTGVKIAIGGKGGVGKTTVCAIWAQLFAEEGFDVIAVDADSDTNLCSAFGVPAEQCPEPLIKMKQLIAERTGTSKDAVGAYFKLNPKVSDLPEKYCLNLSEIKAPAEDETFAVPLKLLVLGGITQAGAGCACSEGAFLKALLTHTILRRQEMVLVDLAAGVEFMGRASVQGIDCLVVVIEPGSRSIETALNIMRMGQELGVKHIAGITNKITSDSQIATIKSKLTAVPILGNIRYSPVMQETELGGGSVIKADTKLFEELAKAKEKLVKLVSQEAKT
ncbi:MAG: ATP-binding protein [Planctomycetota bacterium]